MPFHQAIVQCPVHDSFRVRQLGGMFDLPIDMISRQAFCVEIPALDEAWDIGLIVGPSGSGKSTIARRAFGDRLYAASEWPGDCAVIDGFAAELSVKQITQALGSVGFASPPAWMRPYGVLSNGEKFRCDMARALLAGGELVVFDEFTSLVDRTVARIGSAAVARAVRSGTMARRFVAVTCHYDVARWLQPDWVVDMASQSLARGRLHRPAICLRITSARPAAWRVFKRHHYLSHRLHPAARCFIGWVDDQPAAFVAVLPWPHPHQPGWREHRTVCLPDFQGVGIGNAMSAFVASLYQSTGKSYRSTTSHPGMMRHRARSPLWRMIRPPSRNLTGATDIARRRTLASRQMAAAIDTRRLTATFVYIGPARSDEARRFGLL